MLILLMLASTQMALMTSLGPRELELDETPVRSETLDNSGVVSIDVGSNHACVIGTLNQMKCWGSGEDGKTGHENTASYGDDAKEMGLWLARMMNENGYVGWRTNPHLCKSCYKIIQLIN